MAALIGNPQLLNQATQSSGWYNPKQSEWQNALNLAEDQRNYVNQFRNYAEDQNNWDMLPGTSGQEGGGYGPSHNINWNNMTNPNWNGPKAYNLDGITSGSTYDYGDESQLQANLARIRQFDPNAKVETYDEMDNEGTNHQKYKLTFDQSKLPQAPKGLEHVGNYGRNDLYNNSDRALYVDQNYGIMSDPRNVKEPDDGWMKFAPMAVMAFATLMSGGTLTPAMAAMLKMPQFVGQLASGDGVDPMSALSMAAPFIPGASAVMPYLNAGRSAYNIINGGR